MTIAVVWRQGTQGVSRHTVSRKEEEEEMRSPGRAHPRHSSRKQQKKKAVTKDQTGACLLPHLQSRKLRLWTVAKG